MSAPTSDPIEALRQRFCTELVIRAHQRHADNHATYRYGAAAASSVQVGPLAGWMAYLHAHMGELAWLWGALADDRSREVLLECMVFNSLGHHCVKRGTNTPAYQSAVARMPGCGLVQVEAEAVARVGSTELHQLYFPQRRLRMWATGGSPISLLVHKQYRFERGPDTACEQPGDVVLDCGACWGDTTLWYASGVGADGRVLAFEFIPENLAILEHNRDLNPELGRRIDIIAQPVGARSGDRLRFNPKGPGSHESDEGTVTAETVAIDDLVARGVVPRVDLIKLDVEGAEAAALRGAAETIRRFRPRLAVSVYHRPGDWWSLARLVRALDPGYRLYLDHHTIHREETMLYAVPS